mmetsp:Transcript_99284/g.286480  ORF Transcript_99284/g.286480 Transcript_99284/m.286480 type:complete len:860 (+) Transcript_99284:103-2682(+)
MAMAHKMKRWCRSLLGQFDQRFKDPGEEAAFVLSGETGRLHFVASFSVAVLLLISIKDGLWIRNEALAAEEPLTMHMDARWINIACTVLLLSSCMFAIVASCVKLWTGKWNVVTGEFLVLLISLAITCRVCIGRQSNLQHWSERFADLERLHSDDTNSLLSLDCTVTVVALSSSLRAHRFIFCVLSMWAAWVTTVSMWGTVTKNGLSFTLAVLAMIFGFSVWGSSRFERFIRGEWRQKRRLLEQEQQLNVQSALASSMQSIAERLCDLVVWLDADLLVVSNAVPVNSFFGRTIFGEAFADVILESDRERLSHALERASETQVPECLPVTLLGGAAQNVHLLITSTGATCPKYLIGVSVEQSAQVPHIPQVVAPLRDDAVAALRSSSKALVGETASEAPTMQSRALFSGDVDLDSIAQLGRKERWIIDAEDLRLQVPTCIVGSGAFGIVASAIYRGHVVAVKIAHNRRLSSDRLETLCAELRILRRFHHPNVVLLHGALVEPEQGRISLVYEMVPGTQLDHLITRRKDLAPNDRYQILLSISAALTCLHLHSPSIMHGDLKPQNILLEETSSGFRPKILDFGLAVLLGRGLRMPGGTLSWQAPETLLPHCSANVSADMFSFGWLAMFIIAGSAPYDGATGKGLLDAVRTVVQQGSSPKVELPAEAPFREACQALCRRCLQYDPELRPSAPTVQLSLAGWVDEAAFSRLGVAAMALGMQHVGWDAGLSSLRDPGEGRLPKVQLHFDVDSGFVVKKVACEDLELARTMGLPLVGDSFCDWLGDPASFRIYVRATLSELRAGAKCAPLQQSLSSVLWRPGGGDERLNIVVQVLFPSTSGLVKLRMSDPRIEGRGSSCAKTLTL